MKFIISTRKGFAFKADDFQDSGIPVVKASDIKSGSINKTLINLPDIFKSTHKKALLHKGEIVLSTVGSSPEVRNSAVGQIGVVPQEHHLSLLNQNTVIFSSSSPNVSNKFLALLLKTSSYRDHLDINAHGTANQASLNIDDILDFTSALPELNEQEIITNHLSQTTQKIDNLITKSTRAIELLKEKRTALISACVTGKIDVRDAA